MAEEIDSSQPRTMGLWAASSIGVGAMIGAGVFALLGIAVQIAGSLAWLSFIFAGFIALLTVYSVSKLTVTYPSAGGRVKFILEAFGNGLFSGTINIMMWVGYIVVTALYARAFGQYAVALFGLENEAFWNHVLSSGIIMVFILINFMGAALIGRTELVIVAFKVIILLAFGVLGLMTMSTEYLAVSQDIVLSDILLASGVVFMGYEGFGLIANTAEDIKNPTRNLPRALFIAVIIVILIYILVSLAVIGNLSIPRIVETKEYVLAEAAKPILGKMGFTIMGLAALFSTSSAINATIYGPVRMVKVMVAEGQLPAFFLKRLWGNKFGYIFLITGLVLLIVANGFQLRDIAETGSLIFLLVYLVVNISNFKLYRQTRSNRLIIALAIIGSLMTFCALFYFLAIEGNQSITLFAVIGLLSFAYTGIQHYQISDRNS